MYRSIIMFLSSLTTKKRKKSNKDKVINSTVPFSTSSEPFRIQKLAYRAHYFNFIFQMNKTNIIYWTFISGVVATL